MDIGLGPRKLDRRLRSAGIGWDSVRGAVLTHTPADHWSARSLARLAELRIPFFCHPEHIRPLRLACAEFQSLEWAGLVKTYAPGAAFAPLDGLRCSALPLKHDGGATFGFRIESDESSGSPHWAIGYAADLGSWDDSLPNGLAEVDVLALEFNHDVERQLASGRSRWLINRVLGDFGHLSNAQGAKLLEECAGRSSPGRLRHVVQLHLSRDCNCPTLAEAAAREVIARLQLDVELHTASQDVSCPTIVIADHLADEVISLDREPRQKGPPTGVAILTGAIWEEWVSCCPSSSEVGLQEWTAGESHGSIRESICTTFRRVYEAGRRATSQRCDGGC
jgi:phosphoribosyl 1,2-cyclic phosphodiesterase